MRYTHSNQRFFIFGGFKSVSEMIGNILEMYWSQPTTFPYPCPNFLQHCNFNFKQNETDFHLSSHPKEQGDG